MDPTEESAVTEILRAARIPWNQLDGRTQRNNEGKIIKLRFSPCLELEEIPRTIGDLSSLEEIYLFWASRRLTHLPSDAFDRLRNLRVLQLRWCQGLKELPLLCSSIEELTIEGCDNLVDLSCFSTAKRTWKSLRSLHIIQVGTSGVASLVKAFSIDDERKSDDGKTTKTINSNGLLNCTSSIFFPSLAALSLRHDNIDQVDLAQLWPFFRCCPNLTKVDLGSNDITSLENLVPIATARTAFESGSQEFEQLALRELNLSGNPICSFSPFASPYNINNNHTDENDHERSIDNGSSDGEIAIVEEEMIQSVGWPPVLESGRCQMKRSDQEDDNLLKIVIANPQLVSILVCSGDCEQSSKYNSSGGGYYHDRCDCFQNSALYSPSVRHSLDLNQCSKGKTLMGTRATITYGKGCEEVPKLFCLSKWALVLARTNRIFDLSLDNDVIPHSSCQSRNVEESPGCSSDIVCDKSNATERAIREREASVIYSLLQGPAFAARGNLSIKG